MKHLFLLLTFAFIFSFPAFSKVDSAKIKVFVGTMEKSPRKKDIIVFKGQATKKEFKGITDAKGYFTILIPGGDTYDIQIIGIGEEEDYNTVAIPHSEALMVADLEILYEPAKSFELKDVHFNTGNHQLRTDSYKALNDLVEILKIKDHMTIEIAGHTDNVGDDTSNLTLSQKRAESVRDYLISKGIHAERLKSKGYGETEPVAENDTPEGRQQNRRTEVRILSE